MQHEKKTEKQLTDELEALRQRVTELEVLEVERNRTEEALRKANTFLKNILDSSSSISILSTDLEGNVLFWNTGAENMFGYKADEMVGREKIDILYSGDETNKVTKELSASLLKDREGKSCEIKERTKNGRELCIHLTLSPRFDENGEIVGILGIGEDITERVQAEEALKNSQEKLYQAQKMDTLGTLVAGMAHEINNPINLIMYNISLFQKVWHDCLPVLNQYGGKEPGKKYGGLTYDFLEENSDRLLSDMDMAANRVAKIVSDLKNFARQSNVVDKSSMQINTAVENALRLAQTSLRKSGVELKIDLATDLPSLKGNLQNIEQIILNLVINAVQAIDHDQGVVRIATGFQNKDRRIFVSITDNGCGVAPDISDKLFDPFVTDKQAEGGTGLGLSVTYSLVNAHDGEIVFQSQKGKGTIFTVFFPTVVKEATGRILVVDDDKSIRDMLTKALAEAGPYLVEEASNGIEACIKLGTYRPDLLILDMFMPEMDGLEVCRTIKSETEFSDMNVIITTGFPDHQKLKEVAALGFDRIHYKPFNLPDFLMVISNIFSKFSINPG
jgi:PAS domain S-box-containing protein